jgi:adenylosuccinate lyase
VPTTFGLVAAGWLVALLDARRHLVELGRTGLAVSSAGRPGRSPGSATTASA